jgi:tetratricopeptide (TPR) repeat protein
MPNIPYATVKELASKIKGDPNQPLFAFFLGAGASRQSGVITAGEMIRYFKDQICERSPAKLLTDQEKESWLAAQNWYKKKGHEYSKLFEKFEPKVTRRQQYIEKIVEGQEPSFGYVVLANLMASNYVNAIVTTNFDDLVYSACTSYTGIRPIVYAYGVLASEMRIRAQRAKILKMHGDYLYSTLKNTKEDLETQDPNMAKQVGLVLDESDLVVVGYSGEDKSVMDILSRFRKERELYWCVMRGESPNRNVKRLLTQKEGSIVEIDGFDEMMNEIRQTVQLDVGRMFGSIQDRIDSMIEKLKNFDPRYSANILAETVVALREQSKREQERINKIEQLNRFAQALQAQEAEDPNEAERLYREAIELDPGDILAHNNLGTVLDKLSRAAEAEGAYRKVIELDPTNSDAYYNLGLLLEKDPARSAEAVEAYRRVIDLDPKDPDASQNFLALALTLASTYKRQGNEMELNKYLVLAREQIKPDDWYNLARIDSLSGETDGAIENLKRAAQAESFDREGARHDPDLESICNDPRVVEILESKSSTDTDTDTIHRKAPEKKSRPSRPMKKAARVKSRLRKRAAKKK